MSYTYHTPVIHLSHTCHTLVIHMSHTPVTHMSHNCHTHLSHTCHTPATHLSYTAVTSLSHTCRTPVIHMSHTCRTPVTHVPFVIYHQKRFVLQHFVNNIYQNKSLRNRQYRINDPRNKLISHKRQYVQIWVVEEKHFQK